MHKLRRPKLKKCQEKTYVEFLKNGLCKGQHIYRKGSKKDIEKIKEYATENKFDVLSCIHSVRLEPIQWGQYYKGGYTTIDSSNIYEFSELFLDIDIPLSEIYFKYRKALKESGINNYRTFTSASGNIHLYIKVRKFKEKEAYRKIVKILYLYFKSEGVEIDKSSFKPTQQTFLEGFRVLGKGGSKGKEHKELSSKGDIQTYFELVRIMYSKGFKLKESPSIRYAMHIIKNELLEYYNGKLYLSKLERKYLVHQTVFTKALKRLSEAQAIKYKTYRGVNGYVHIEYFYENKFDDCIKGQKTRKENYIYINVMYFLEKCWYFSRNALLKGIVELCQYIKKNERGLSLFLCIFQISKSSQGVLSGSSGGLVRKNRLNLSKFSVPEAIPKGERNKTLCRTLIKAKAMGFNPDDISLLSRKLHSNMQQVKGCEYKTSEVESVVKWVHRLKFYNNGQNERTI